jgi:hypothetical protein
MPLITNRNRNAARKSAKEAAVRLSSTPPTPAPINRNVHAVTLAPPTRSDSQPPSGRDREPTSGPRNAMYPLPPKLVLMSSGKAAE